MNNIVVVEDRLERGISLAEQFKEFAQKHQELELEVSDVCYFCADSDKAKKDMDGVDKRGFNIKHVTLLNFNKTLDEYIKSKDKKGFVVMDYILEDDGSEGTPIRRVNIRYARNKERYKTNQLWFYTGTGTENEHLLSQLIGKEHVLDVEEVDDNLLRLKLENGRFIDALNS